MSTTIERLDQVSRTLDSLITIKKYDKYYFDEGTKQFCKSGAPIVDFVSYVWGPGYATQLVQGCSRTVSGESYHSFGNGLKALEDGLEKVIEAVRNEVIGLDDSKIRVSNLERVIRRVRYVCSRLPDAGDGLNRLLNTSYKDQDIKRQEIKPYSDQFQGNLLVRIEQLYIDLVRKRTRNESIIEKEEEESSTLQEINEWSSLADEFEEKIRISERRRIQRERERINSKPHPETGLSNNDLAKIKKFLFSKKYGPFLRKKLTEALKRSPENAFLYIRPSLSQFRLPVQYYLNRLVIHLKKLGGPMMIGKGRYKVVTKSVLFKGATDTVGTVCANGVSKFKVNSRQQRVADNEKKYLEMFQGKPGILPVYSVSRYQSEDGKMLKQSVLMPLCHHGEMAKYIEEKHVSLSDQQKLKILYDVAHGLTYIHDVAVHQDIKPENILLKNDLSGAYIADFGICRERHDQKAIGGTSLYMAPEVARIFIESSKAPKEFKEKGMDLNEAKQIKSAIINKLRNAPSSQSDIWSFGCTGWLLMTGEETPHMKALGSTKPASEVMDIYMDENALPEAPEGTVLHLLRRMMHPSPHERPTAHEVKEELQHFLNVSQ